MMVYSRKMDVLCLSDLHFELHRDGGAEFLSLLNTRADVLILAGDICGGWMVPWVMERFCKKYDHVIYVHGNHEFYRCPRPEVLRFTKEACKKNKNLHWLDCNSIEIDRVVFHGTPLWFKESPLAPKHAIGDWARIKDYDSWVYEENRRALQFLTENVQKGDVVVTHHLPTQKSVAPQFEKSVLNPFFVCDVEGLIRVQEPVVWFHGHTHASLDYEIESTRIVCNPHGYGVENIHAFDLTKVVTISPAP
jgi:Icc-related predicted phosphoesterase